MNTRQANIPLSSFIVPAKETSVENGGWKRILCFIGICAVLAAIVYGIAYDPEDAAKTASKGILPFTLLVVIASIGFGSKKPLSKPRVDLIYYGMVAFSAAILYLDNEDQRAKLQNEIRVQEAKDLAHAIDTQRAEVERLAAEHRGSNGEVVRTSKQLLAARPLLDALRAAASQAFESRKSANDRYCLSVQERCFSERIRQRSEFRNDNGRADRIPRLDSCESQELACALMQSDKTSLALKKLSATTQLDEEILDIDIDAVSDKNIGVPTQQRTNSIASSLASLQSLVRESQRARLRIERLGEQQATSTKRLKQLERRLKEITPSTLTSRESESASQPTTSKTSSTGSQPLAQNLNIGLWAKFVWSWVLVTLLGLKLAREPFVFRRRSSAASPAPNLGVLPSSDPALTSNEGPADSTSLRGKDGTDSPQSSEALPRGDDDRPAAPPENQR
jgi:hypothetical protein